MTEQMIANSGSDLVRLAADEILQAMFFPISLGAPFSSAQLLNRYLCRPKRGRFHPWKDTKLPADQFRRSGCQCDGAVSVWVADYDGDGNHQQRDPDL